MLHFTNKHIKFILSLIVYYATREVKRWTDQSTCKLPPEPKARFLEYFDMNYVLSIIETENFVKD